MAINFPGGKKGGPKMPMGGYQCKGGTPGKCGFPGKGEFPGKGGFPDKGHFAGTGGFPDKACHPFGNGPGGPHGTPPGFPDMKR